jgi:hypothetical protein
MLCFPLKGYEWEAFSHKRLKFGFGLMFLVSSKILALYGLQGML